MASRLGERSTETAPDLDRAMQRAGRWLALRPRTEKELTDRLLQGGFDEDVVTRAITRLKELRLVDDGAFARQWIEERSSRKHLGSELLVAELVDKGVERSVVDEALVACAIDEGARAKALAAAQLKKLAGVPLLQQGTRLRATLARKGFSAEIAEEAVRTVLPPEGWD